MTKIISSSNPLTPITGINLTTGEILVKDEYNESITHLISFVKDETVKLYAQNKDVFETQISEAKRIGSPNSFARQKGYSSQAKDLPANILAKSRINELVLHKLTSEVRSYVNNPNPRKQSPNFGLKINLGAVDKQMAKLSYDTITQNLFLELKCWDKHLLLEFWLPNNLKNKTITKWCLPSIQIEKGVPQFRFIVEEQSQKRATAQKEWAGLDLGVREPYTIVVVNNKGQRTADYHSTKGLRELNEKRSRLILEKKHTQKKIDAYTRLGLDSSKLVLSRDRLRNKITHLGSTVSQKMGNEIASKLDKHSLNTLVVEDLTWVRGNKYGGRWNHSAQQASIKQSLSRKGIKVKKVDPKNTSQTCSKCSVPIIHNTKTRTVWCGDCKLRLDRDYNAAINIIKKCPDYSSMIGDDRTVILTEVMEDTTLLPTHVITRTPT